MKHIRRRSWVVIVQMTILFGTVAVVVPDLTNAQDVVYFEKRMTEFTLGNGLKFLILERHQAPVVSFLIYADVGSVDEVIGITGLAHLFEHMAFKGTKTIGTRDYETEEKAMARIDDAFLALKAERRKGDRADKTRLEQLENHFKEAQERAQKYLVHDEYEEVFARAGSFGFNAGTSGDGTAYVVSLPSNKVELWMMMESDRFAHPVLREFYKEKDVVMEERRLEENSPFGRLVEEFMAIAYKAHPYGHPVVGYMSDLETLTRAEAEAFFKKYYSPSNLTIAIVGDVHPPQIRKLATKYFGVIPSGPKPDPVETVEPPQLGERRVVLEDPSQPLIMIGYHQPSINHPDNAVFQAFAEIIGAGRTSRLHKSLVKDRKIAVSVEVRGGRGKYPGLFTFMAVPAKGHTPEECEQAIYVEIEKLKTDLVSPPELQKAKTRVRAKLIRQLESNSGLAAMLTFREVLTGDWRNLFRELDKIEKVTVEEIQRIANEFFTSKNRTVGIIQTTGAEQ